MSDSIWKTPDQKLDEADTRKQILFYAGGSSFPYLGWNYPNKGFGTWNYEDVQKWAYLEDVLAQADKAERLQKAVDYIYKLLLEEANFTAGAHLPNKYQQKIFNEIKQLIKGE